MDLSRRPQLAPQLSLLLADIASHPDGFDPERSETWYRKAMAVAEAQEQRPVLAHCHFGLGTLYRRTGKRELAQEHLTAATTMYREMDMRFYLEQAVAEGRVIEKLNDSLTTSHRFLSKAIVTCHGGNGQPPRTSRWAGARFPFCVPVRLL